MKNWACLAVVFGLFLHGAALALEDPGKAKIGLVKVMVYHATNGETVTASAKRTVAKGTVAKDVVAKGTVAKEMVERMSNEARLRFKHYRLLGKDSQPLLRSYESWAQPLKPSDEILVRFEAQGRPSKQTAVLDLELWLGRKKTVKTDARLEGDRPLFVLGPEWRGGRLIIAVALASEQKPGS